MRDYEELVKALRDEDNCNVLDYIDEAADVRPVVRGKWGTDRFKMERMICSECGVVLEWSKINNFCPNCGADMREEDEHETTDR